MGWLYMTSLKGFSGPRQYLDAQLTYERPDHTSKVLRSALVKMRVYYAAVERIETETGERIVWAAICLVRYNPRDREGYVFGYKDMDETMGPCVQDCPKAILDLLTPTDHHYAVEWRAACRTRLAAAQALARKPSPQPGQIIILDSPLSFRNGRTLQRFEVVANPRNPRAVVFREPGCHALYRIPNVKKHGYRLEEPPVPEGEDRGKSSAGETNEQSEGALSHVQNS
jgi:hypothetical protein